MPKAVNVRRSRNRALPRPRNPRASSADHRQVLETARRVAREVDPSGRAAVLLTGSWARGVAHEASDIDLWVIGGRDRHTVFERDGRLVSVKYAPAADFRAELRNPARLDGAVPGWRHAKILRDPRGVAARLKSEARRFRWSSVRRRRDAYVTQELAELAEEVAKLLRAMETDERETAAVQRNLLANRMAMLRGLAFEHLSETENGLWEMVGKRAGRAFQSAQRAALGVGGETWRESCEAALRLYVLTARASGARLRGEHRRIVEAACRRAGYPLVPKRTGRR
jgi:predicted nucleotidyltransferase